MRRLARLLAILLFFLLGHAARAANSDGLIAIETEDGFLITDNGEAVFFYQRKTTSLDGKFRRAHYIHPFYGLDGEVLTEDFPTDHPHHRGIYSGWHHLTVAGENAGDTWRCMDVDYDVRSLKVVRPDEHRLTLVALTWWRSRLLRDADGSPRPVGEEEWTITVGPVRNSVREVDVDIRIRALVADVHLAGSGNTRGYGGFSTRLRLPEGVRFTGHSGSLEPQRQPLEAGPWIDLTASYGIKGELSGLTIMPHPETPGKPRQWLLRRDGSMQNHAYPGRHPILLSRETPLTLRYRLLIHRGEPDPARIAESLQEYAKH